MKTQLRLVVFTAVMAFALNARAQVTYVVNTDSSAGSVNLTTGGIPTGIGAATLFIENTAIQTISGFSSLSSISWSLTDTFGGAPATFSAYVAQWNTGNNSISAGTLVSFGIPDAAPFNPGLNLTADLTFNGSLTGLNPSLTYALLLSTTSGGGGFVANVGSVENIVGGANQAFFSSRTAGYAATSQNTSGSDAAFATALAATNSGTMFTPGTYAYTMSVTGSLAAVPEPKTAAAAIVALFVAALIGRRTWRRRKSVAIPVVA